MTNHSSQIDLKPLEHFFNEADKKNRSKKIVPTDRKKLITVKLYSRGLTWRNLADTKKFKPSKLYELKAGDFVYSKIDARHGAWGFVRPELEGGLVSGDFPILELNQSIGDKDFVAYALSEEKMWHGLGNMSTGTTGRRRVNQREFLQIVKLPALSIAEQKAIAHILTSVRVAISEQERLTEKLKKLKRSLMQSLFTLGTRREKTKMTEVGIIPESWEVVTLGEVSKISTGTTPSTHNKEYYKGSNPFIKTTDILNNRINSSNVFISDEAVKKYRLKKYPAGTVLLAMYGQGKTRGQVSLLDIAASTSQNAAAIETTEKLHNVFLWQYLLSKYERLRDHGAHGQISHLNLGYMKNFKLPLPSIEEQKVIARTLEVTERAIISSQEKHAMYDRLFKTLLHEFMSGKRKIVVPIPEEKRDPKEIFKDAFIQTYLVKNVPSPYVSHIRLEKMTYFTRRFSTNGPVSRYGTFTFGPYDRLNKYKGGLKLALNKKYIEHGDSWGYKVGSNADQIKNYAYSREVTAMDAVLGSLGQKSDNELEVLATTDFSLYKLLADKVKPTAQLVLEYINSVDVWKEKVQRLKLDETKIAKAMSELRNLISQGLSYPQP